MQIQSDLQSVPSHLTLSSLHNLMLGNASRLQSWDESSLTSQISWTFSSHSLKCSRAQGLWEHLAAFSVLVTLLGNSCSGCCTAEEIQAPWEKQEENAPWEKHVSCEHAIFASDFFFSQLPRWDKCRDDKILSYCLFKTKLWDSKTSLLYSIHSPPHTHTILRVCFFAEKSPCVKRLPHCAFPSKVGLVLPLKEKPSLLLRAYTWEKQQATSWKSTLAFTSSAQCFSKALPRPGCGYHYSHGEGFAADAQAANPTSRPSPCSK